VGVENLTWQRLEEGKKFPSVLSFNLYYRYRYILPYLIIKKRIEIPGY
jgi:hypothetical protein